MKTTIFPGGTTAYENWGKGKPFVFLHGFCEDHQMWIPFAQFLSREGIRVITVDLPGFGASPFLVDTSIDKMARAVMAVLDREQLSSATFMGHSMGGYVALSIAEQFPDRINGLGLINSHPFDDLPEQKEKREKSKAFISKNGSAAYVQQLIPQLFPKKRQKDQLVLIQSLIERAATFPPEGITEALTAMQNRPDRSKVLEQSEAPVLLVHGGLDHIVDQNAFEHVAPLPETAAIALKEDAGHMIPFEEEDWLKGILLDFARFQTTVASS